MDELTLNKSGLGVLKNIAHKLGVPGSKSHTRYTKKNKDELIQQILKFQKMKEPQNTSGKKEDNNKSNSDSSDDVPKRKLQKPPKDNNQMYMLLAVAGVIIVGASLYNQQKSVVNSPQKHVVNPSKSPKGRGIYSF